MTSRFPQSRLRRLRESAAVRLLARETSLSAKDFVYPLFVTHGRDVCEPVEPMPGVYHLSTDRLAAEAEAVAHLGIPAVLLFGLPARKDGAGTEAYNPDGIIQEAVRTIKQATPQLLVITDVCLCEYTDHGHCGAVVDGRVDNDATLELLAKTAISHAEAGADVVAPSAMMDGQVGAIRQALDVGGFQSTPIMAYSAKYASSFYGAVPGSRGFHAAVWRPSRLPDGPGQREAGPSGDGDGHTGGGGYNYGEACPGILGCHIQGETGLCPPHRRIQRQR